MRSWSNAENAIEVRLGDTRVEVKRCRDGVVHRRRTDQFSNGFQRAPESLSGIVSTSGRAAPDQTVGASIAEALGPSMQRTGVGELGDVARFFPRARMRTR